MKQIKFIRIACELVTVKKEIKRLQQQERRLKKELKPFVTFGETLNLSEADIYCSDHKTKRTLYRHNVLQFIRKTYGDKIADDVDYNCTEILPAIKSIHVKLKP